MNKRNLVIGILVSLVILLVSVIPASAAPGDVTWNIGVIGSGLVITNVNLNTNSLQINYFEIINNGNNTARFFIYQVDQQGEWIYPPYFQMSAAPHTTVRQTISNLKYYRVPATDHDDPDSIRIPKDMVFTCG